MAETKALRTDQLKNAYGEQVWFVPTKIAIEGLTAEQAHWKDSIDNHSIAELVSHLTFWNELSLEAVKGDSLSDFKGEHEETFDLYLKTDWKTAEKKLDSVQTEWGKWVADATDAKLWNGIRILPT